jgi:hypothetical protein
VGLCRSSTISEVESHKEEKYQIDLMAPPPLRSSPERDGETDFVAVDPKPMVTDVEMEIKPQVKEDEKVVKLGNKEEIVNVESEKAKIIAVDEAESHKPVVTTKERNIDLQLDLEKTDRDSGTASISGSNKLNHHVQKQQSQHTHNEKIAQTSSLPLPMSVPGWPGGLPPMGYDRVNLLCVPCSFGY